MRVSRGDGEEPRADDRPTVDEIKPLLKASVSLPGMGQVPAIKVRKEHAWYRDVRLLDLALHADS